MPALTDFVALGGVLRRAEMARLSPSVRMAHRLCAFTAARIGNVVNAEWREFHLDEEQAFWIIPRAKIKVTARDLDHRIPSVQKLSRSFVNGKGCLDGKGMPSPLHPEVNTLAASPSRKLTA